VILEIIIFPDTSSTFLK